MWTEEEIETETLRIIRNSMRLDRLRDFAGFVTGQFESLLDHGKRPGFVFQHALNSADSSPVADAAKCREPWGSLDKADQSTAVPSQPSLLAHPARKRLHERNAGRMSCAVGER